MKDTSKSFNNSQDNCNTIIPRLFSTGCIESHPSIVQPGEDPDTLLLQECLQRVKNDTRCVGGGYYVGSMVENYWPKNVEIEEDNIVECIRKLIPPGDIYGRLLYESQTEGLTLAISWEQHLLGRSCKMSLTFDLLPECSIELKATYENEDDDNEHHYLVETQIDIEECLQVVSYICTQPWYDFVYDDGPITINGTEYESIRLRGKHSGQKIYMYEIVNNIFGLKRNLLNVSRK